MLHASYKRMCVEYERKKQQPNIDFPTFRLPTRTKIPLNIIFDDFGT